MIGKSVVLGSALLFVCCGRTSDTSGTSGAVGGVGPGGSGTGASSVGGSTGGSGHAAAGGSSPDGTLTPTPVTPPEANFPERPPWTSGPSTGQDGWRQSSEPFCSPWVAGEMWPSLLSTPERVYLDLSAYCNPLAQAPCSAEPEKSYQSLFVNEGTGWRAVSHFLDSPTRDVVGAFPDGSLIATGLCAAGRHDLSGGFECLGARAVWASEGAFVRGLDVYHLSSGGVSPLLSKYTQASWQDRFKFSESAVPHVLINLGKDVVVAGEAGLLMRGDPDLAKLDALSGPVADYIAGTAIPGGNFALADAEGNVRLNISGTWVAVEGLKLAVDARLAASPSGSVYAISRQDLVRIQPDGSFEAVIKLQGSNYFSSLAINSDSEVFLAMNAQELAGYQCGKVVLGWFDGSELHLF